MWVCVVWIHIDSDMAIAIGVMYMTIPILQIWIPWHMHHSNPLSTSWIFNALHIFIEAID